jgi:hypothetical protein
MVFTAWLSHCIPLTGATQCPDLEGQGSTPSWGCWMGGFWLLRLAHCNVLSLLAGLTAGGPGRPGWCQSTYPPPIYIHSKIFRRQILTEAAHDLAEFRGSEAAQGSSEPALLAQADPLGPKPCGPLMAWRHSATSTPGGAPHTTPCLGAGVWWQHMPPVARNPLPLQQASWLHPHRVPQLRGQAGLAGASPPTPLLYIYIPRFFVAKF